MKQTGLPDDSKPVNRAGFDRYRDRLQEKHPVHSIDSLFALECEIALSYYHGSKKRAGWCMLVNGIRMDAAGFYYGLVFRFCDKVGWTRSQRIPETDFFERHSAKCDKMNCNDMDCVQSGIPKWFRKLAGIDLEL